MTDFNTDIAAIEANPTPDTIPAFASSRGKLRGIKAKYTLLGSEVATDRLFLCRLYRGDIVNLAQTNIFAQNPGTQLVFDIGDDDATADPDRYADGVDVSAGGLFNLYAGGTEAAAAIDFYTFSNVEGFLIATFAAVNTLTPAQRLLFDIVISRNN